MYFSTYRNLGTEETLTVFEKVKYIGFLAIAVVQMYRDKVVGLCSSYGNTNEDKKCLKKHFK